MGCFKNKICNNIKIRIFEHTSEKILVEPLLVNKKLMYFSITF